MPSQEMNTTVSPRQMKTLPSEWIRAARSRWRFSLVSDPGLLVSIKDDELGTEGGKEASAPMPKMGGHKNDKVKSTSALMADAGREEGGT